MNHYTTIDPTLSDEEYNKQVDKYGYDYHRLNNFVMSHTLMKCENDRELVLQIEHALMCQYIVNEEDPLFTKPDGPTTNIIVTRKRTLEAASAYKGIRTSVLNFANNHSVGGAPFSAGAQEECLCRETTLYPCLKALEKEFYVKHQEQYRNGQIDDFGSDDLIYTRDVIVFKSDESAPKILKDEDWQMVDVITCAAPVVPYGVNPERLYDVIYKRLTKVLDVAKKEQVEVLILGAWGCGAFHNSPRVVASIFKALLRKYHFEKVEFAIYDRVESPNDNYHAFKETLED